MRLKGTVPSEQANEIVGFYESFMNDYNSFQGISIVDRKSMELDPKAHYVAGQVYFLLGNYEKAINAFNLVSSQDQDITLRIKALEAISNERLGNIEKSRDIINNYKSKYPNFEVYVLTFRKPERESSLIYWRDESEVGYGVAFFYSKYPIFLCIFSPYVSTI